jgi:hypothetical protein
LNPKSCSNFNDVVDINNTTLSTTFPPLCDDQWLAGDRIEREIEIAQKQRTYDEAILKGHINTTLCLSMTDMRSAPPFYLPLWGHPRYVIGYTSSSSSSSSSFSFSSSPSLNLNLNPNPNSNPNLNFSRKDLFNLKRASDATQRDEPTSAIQVCCVMMCCVPTLTLTLTVHRSQSKSKRKA